MNAAQRTLAATASLAQDTLTALTAAANQATHWATHTKHANYGLAAARILLGLSALGVLLTNYRTRYYVYGSGGEWLNAVYGHNTFTEHAPFGAFRAVSGNDTAFTLLYLATIALAISYTLGWRTRIITLPLWLLYLGLIQSNNAITGQVGDILWRIAVLALLFTDAHGRWSLDAKRRKRPPRPNRPTRHPRIAPWVGNLIHNTALAFIIGQLCIQYVSAALYKTGGSWQDGTAVYLSLQLEDFRVFPALSDLISGNGLIIGLLTYSTILLQALFPGLLLNKATRVIALLGMISFHIGIGLFMGLAWFSLTMIAVDMVLVTDQTWNRLRLWGQQITTPPSTPHPAQATASLTGAAPHPLRSNPR